MRSHVLVFLLLFSMFSKLRLLTDSNLYFDIPFVSFLFDHPTASWIVLLGVLLVELVGVLLLYFSQNKKT